MNQSQLTVCLYSRLQNSGVYRIYNLKVLAVAPEQTEGVTKGLNSVITIVGTHVLFSREQI